MKDLFDRKRIMDSLKFYNSPTTQKDAKDSFAKMNGALFPATEVGVDQYIEALKSKSLKLSRKEFIKTLCVYKAWYRLNGDADSVKIIDKLIGDTRLYNRILWMTDGSYLKSGIRFDLECGISFRGNEFEAYYENHSSYKKIIRDICNNYECLVIHALNFESVMDIQEEIEWNRYMDEYEED